MGKLVLSGKAICLGFEAPWKADFLDISLNFLDMYVESKRKKKQLLVDTPGTRPPSFNTIREKRMPVAWFRTPTGWEAFLLHF